jgi:hypothetical protein
VRAAHALQDRRSTPARQPHAVPAETVAAIERLRHERRTGQAIARQLGRPRSTVSGILRRLGLGHLAALDPKPSVIRYERENPGELIRIDTKKLGRIVRPSHRVTGNRRNAVRGAGPPGPAGPGPCGNGSAVLLAADGTTSTSPSMTRPASPTPR